MSTPFEIKAVPQIQTIQKGSQVRILCLVRPPETEIWIRWLFNGDEIQGKTSLRGEHHRVIIKSVKKKNEGTYTCQASDENGRIEESNSVLNIIGQCL